MKVAFLCGVLQMVTNCAKHHLLLIYLVYNESLLFNFKTKTFMVIMTDRSNMTDLEEEFEFESSIDNDKNIEKLLQIIC